MTVYIVTYMNEYSDGTCIEGVYLSKQKAEEIKRAGMYNSFGTLRTSMFNWQVEEHKVIE
jgi:hypothetical protein